jgi:hypothetical protein
VLVLGLVKDWALCTIMIQDTDLKYPDFKCVHHESRRYRVQVEVFELIFLLVQECWLVGVLNAMFIWNSLENQMKMNQTSKTWWSLDSEREYNVKSFSRV